MSTINERILEVAEDHGLNPTAFSVELGLSKAAIRNLFRRDSKPSWEIINAILTKYSYISAEWFMRGIGPKLTSQAKQSKEAA